MIYVRVAFREGNPEVNPRNRTFSALAERGGFGLDDEATQIHSAVAPGPDDIIMIKKRVGAFSGSDLDVVTRSRGITSLVLTGIATSGVVLSTLRHAADLDFDLTVLSDGCADADPKVHEILLSTVFPRQARVMTTHEWIAEISRSPAPSLSQEIGVRGQGLAPLAQSHTIAQAHYLMRGEGTTRAPKGALGATCALTHP